MEIIGILARSGKAPGDSPYFVIAKPLFYFIFFEIKKILPCKLEQHQGHHRTTDIIIIPLLIPYELFTN